ncbi:MAG: hypothetical protein E7091_01500 [Bacteroidales bacterium]|nr:hypothetical protein [Bacteroidales bacterium]
MSKILKPLLLTVLAVLTLQSTAQSLPYKGATDITLSELQTITQAGDISTYDTRFMPEGDFTLDLGLLMRSGTMQATAINSKGLGFSANFTNNEIHFTQPEEETAASYPITDSERAHTYRIALNGSKLSIYSDTTLLGTQAAAVFPLLPDAGFYGDEDNIAQQTGIYDKRNLIRNPGFETEGVVVKNDASDYRFWPAEWEITNANATSEQANGVRCNKDNATYANGREGSSALMFRQDGSGGFTAANGSYIYQQLSSPLKAGRKYELSFQVLSHTNDLGKTYAVAVGSAKGTWDNLCETWTAPSAKQTLQTYYYEFTATEQSESYVAFVCYGGSGIVHLDRVALREIPGDYNLFSISTDGTVDLDILGISYSDGAFSPVKRITNTLYNGGEYYLYNTYYSRLLGLNASNIPALAASDAEASNAAYTWCAESSNKEGYYRLRHKATGKYLAASTANTWSMVLNDAQATNNTDLWAITEGLEGTITSLYNGKVLGTDKDQEANEYIGVYYDKSKGELSTWQLVEAQFALSESRLALYVNKLQETITLGEQIISSGIYGLAATTNLKTCIDKAKEIAANATIEDIAVIVETTAEVEQAIDSCKESTPEDSRNIRIWATYDSNGVSLDNSYTLALDSVRFANDSTAYLLIRNRDGKGALVGISPSTVGVAGKFIAQGLDTTATIYSYRFVVDNGAMTICRNGQALGTVATYAMPSLTTGGTKSEFTGLGTQHLDSYVAEIVSPSKALGVGEYDGNKYNKIKRQLACVYNLKLVIDQAADFFLLNEAATLEGSTINLINENSWLIAPHSRPSVANSKIAPYIRLNGARAKQNSNYRAAIYLDGAAIIPHSSSIQPFTAYTGELYSGEETQYGKGRHSNLGTRANTMRSFILKRGYMVTLAANSDGSGYSRVFVADHEDLLVPVVPEALNRRVSSIIVKPWQYVSKKGWGSTKGNSTINTHTETIRANWFYTWSADRNNTTDLEYVPIKQHLWWPGWAQINALENCTHVLGYNEPEHSEQHGSAQCSCGGAINEWKAFTHHTEFFESGMRIGSPSPTDAGWLKNYVQYCHNYAYRCDFVVTHAYWKDDINTWRSKLEEIHNATGRPIWITEMENGASWDVPSETNVNDAAKKYQKIFDLLESLDYVERYVPYNDDLWYNKMLYDDGWPTPAGAIFRDYPSSFAYKAEQQYIPDWWKPSIQNVAIMVSYNEANNELQFAVNNPNADVTDALTIEYSYDNVNWETAYEETERYRFDQTGYVASVNAGVFEDGTIHFRLHVTTLIGGNTYSDIQSFTLDTSSIAFTTQDGIQIQCGNGYLEVSAVAPQIMRIYTTTGNLICYNLKKGRQRIALPQGVYIISGKKYQVK